MKNNFDVCPQCVHISETEMSAPKRINKVTNLTLRPKVKRAAKRYCKAAKKKLSPFVTDLLEERLIKLGYLSAETT